MFGVCLALTARPLLGFVSCLSIAHFICEDMAHIMESYHMFDNNFCDMGAGREGKRRLLWGSDGGLGGGGEKFGSGRRSESAGSLCSPPSPLASPHPLPQNPPAGSLC